MAFFFNENHSHLHVTLINDQFTYAILNLLLAESIDLRAGSEAVRGVDAIIRTYL